MEPEILKAKDITFYIFKENGALVSFIFDSATPKEIILDAFVNKSEVRGAGKELLCKTIPWIRDTLPTVQTITLASVPHSNVRKARQMTKENAQKSLNKYYISIGFQPTKVPHEFEVSLDRLDSMACKKGGKRRTRKHRGGANANSSQEKVQRFIDMIIYGDREGLTKALESGELDPNEPLAYHKDDEYTRHWTRKNAFEGTLLGILSAFDPYHLQHFRTLSNEKWPLEMRQYHHLAYYDILVNHGADPKRAWFQNKTEAKTEFESYFDTWKVPHSCLVLFMIGYNEKIVQKILDLYRKEGSWTPEHTQSVLDGLQTAIYDLDFSSGHDTLQYLQRRWLPTLQKMEHEAKMKNVLLNVRYIPNTRRKKKALHNELALLGPIHEVSFPGGNVYRQAKEEFERQIRE